MLGAKSPHRGGTLIIDQQVIVTEPLVIPAHFTLAGVGIYGGGQLFATKTLSGPIVSFEDDPMQGRSGHSILRDLDIQSKFPNIGVHVTGAGPIYIDGVQIFGMTIGVRGEDATSVILSNCLLDGNVVGIWLHGACRHWRIRDSDIRGSGFWGINLSQIDVADTLIHGCNIENNGQFAKGHPDSVGAHGGIVATSVSGAVIFGNRFESNGFTAAEKACANVTGKTWTRFLCNSVSGDQFRPGELNENDGVAQPSDALQPKPAANRLHIGFNASADFSSVNGGADFADSPFPMSRINEPRK